MTTKTLKETLIGPSYFYAGIVLEDSEAEKVVRLLNQFYQFPKENEGFSFRKTKGATVFTSSERLADAEFQEVRVFLKGLILGTCKRNLKSLFMTYSR